MIHRALWHTCQGSSFVYLVVAHYYEMAMIILVINIINVTGAQILRSHTLLVIRFNMVPNTKYPTINQIAISENEDQRGQSNPALLRTMIPINANIAI